MVRYAVAVFIVGVSATPAPAHTFYVEARAQGKECVIRAGYDRNEPSVAAVVLITDAKEAEVFRALTDGEGKAKLPLPAPGRYHLFVNDGAGHAAETWIDVPHEPPVDGALLTPSPSVSEADPFPLLPIVAGLAIIALLTLIGMKALGRRSQPS